MVAECVSRKKKLDEPTLAPTPWLEMLHNNYDFLGNLHQTIAHEHNGQQSHSLHEMRLGEAEDWAFVGEDEADNGFGAGDEIPCHVGASADIVVKGEGYSKENNCRSYMKACLRNDWHASTRIFSQLEKGSEILDGEAKSGHH